MQIAGRVNAVNTKIWKDRGPKVNLITGKCPSPPTAIFVFDRERGSGKCGPSWFAVWKRQIDRVRQAQ